jgi:ankyrin repeat protein
MDSIDFSYNDIEDFVEIDSNINKTDFMGSTILHRAIEKYGKIQQNKKRLTLLNSINKLNQANIYEIERELDLFYRYYSHFGMPYHIKKAIDTNDINLLREIISKEFINIDKYYLKLIKLILNKEIDINIKDKSGFTPFDLVFKYKFDDVMLLLIEKEGNINTKNQSGETLLDISLSDKNNYKISKLLFGKMDTSKENLEKILFYSLEYHDTDFFKKYIDKIDNINIKYEGYNLLHTAIKCGNLEIVKLLLDRGIDINEKTLNNLSTFYLANSSVLDYLYATQKENIRK